MDPVFGVILAGGAGRRIGGDKPAVQLVGRSLLDHVRGRIAPQCASLALNVDPDRATPPGWSGPILGDGAWAGAGPLAGILAAMVWAKGRGAERVLTVPVDTPFLPRDLAERLAQTPAAVVLAETADGWHGTCGLWSVALAAPLEDALASGTRKVTKFAQSQGAVGCLFAATDPSPFFNINRPEDLVQAEALLSAGR